jgi:hypothetical protein
MTVRQPAQPTLPLGFGPIQWGTLAPEIRATVLELWIQLLQDHVVRRATSEGEGAAP